MQTFLPNYHFSLQFTAIFRGKGLQVHAMRQLLLHPGLEHRQQHQQQRQQRQRPDQLLQRDRCGQDGAQRE